MEYPSDFNVPVFPAGSRIALSRFMGIASCVLILLIIFTCMILLWAVRSERIDPFIVSIDELTGQWTVVGHTHGNQPRKYTATELLQQAVTLDFTANWFTLNANAEQNEAIWKLCDRVNDCGNENDLKFGDKECSMYCLTSDTFFSNFVSNIIPEYQTRIANGERWVIDKTAIQIEPAGEITTSGGTWRLSATVASNISGDMNIVAFVKVAQNIALYPQTLGFYVADFNAYKIN